MAMIELNHVTKEYQLGQMISLWQKLKSVIVRPSEKSKYYRKPFKAINDVSLKIDKGEVIGIIGRNGAGKSTLLKLISAINVPTNGTIRVNGSIAPLIEVGAGLHPLLTGHENIYLNSAILGARKKDVKNKIDEIIDFAELKEYNNTPIKRYSTGMKVRLGFAIATTIKSDILIIDEVLAVGDLAFQRKCIDKIATLIKEEETTVILVSHNIRQVNRICSRVIMLENGKIVADGESSKICNKFYEISDKKAIDDAKKTTRPFKDLSNIDILKVDIINHNNESTKSLKQMNTFNVVLSIKVLSKIRMPSIAVGIQTTDYVNITTTRSKTGELPDLNPGIYKIICEGDKLTLLPGVYSLKISVDAGEIKNNIFYSENICSFRIIDNNFEERNIESEGFIPLLSKWSIVKS